MFNIFLVLLSILRSNINVILSRLHSLTKVWNFIDLHSIFKDKWVISSVPNYFKKILKLLSFVINITNLLDLLYSTLIKFLLIWI